MKFDVVEIVSRDPCAVVAFYRDSLGLSVTDDGVRIGGSVLRLRAGEPKSPYHLAFNIPANQILQAKEWLERRVRLLSDEIFDFDFWNAEAVYFEDPDHNVLELIARRNLANDVVGPFDERGVLSICEFGLPVTDPPSAIDELEVRLGLGVYDGDRRTFTTVGSEEALFIVVPEGRAWLPTEHAAVASPADVTIVAPEDAQLQIGPIRIRATSKTHGHQ